jgi:N-acetyl-gamma-glutamyl-phosphate reductase
MMDRKKIVIVGATGFTGSELVRILLGHTGVEIVGITSESRAGEKFSDVHPQFLGLMELELISIEDIDTLNPDLVFLALPHGVSMDFVSKYHNKYRIVDFSGDFRLSSKEVYEQWYGQKHIFGSGFVDAVYGLPELYRDQIRNAALVANPGCFPTAGILAMAPLLGKKMVSPNGVIVDAKTGVTGAGVKPRKNTHFPVVNDNFTAYGVKTHRHTIEIQEKLSEHSSLEADVLFTPHLLPVDRGILATCYSRPQKAVSDDMLKEIFDEYYEQEPFIRHRKSLPNLKQVRGTNFCDVYVTYDERTNFIISMASIDNLVKGAAGAAVQNMNLMLGLNENTGLNIIPLQP